MAPPLKSRWENTDADIAGKRRKEECRRRKIEEQQHHRQLRQEHVAHQASSTATRPAKRRRLSAETAETPATQGAAAAAAAAQAQSAQAQAAHPATSPATQPLYRFPLRRWSKAGSVDAYDKHNDIEEGTYGWVARARKVSTGEVVALKRLKLYASDRHGFPVTGLREIQILKQCDHQNIVKLQDVVVGSEQTNNLPTYVRPRRTWRRDIPFMFYEC